MANEIVNFVTDKCGFVNPEKITAIDLYGFEKAKDMWKDGEPNFQTLNNLRIIASKKALIGNL